MDTKRQNFNVTPAQDAEIAWLREALGAPTAKEAILRAVRIAATLARELQEGGSVYLERDRERVRVLIPELEAAAPRWQYLAPRAHPWRRQLYIKGRRLKAFDIWVDMSTNARSVEEAAEDWDLPVEAIREIVAYCETHRQLLDLEAMEEKRRLIAAGVWHGVVSPDR